MCRMIGVLTQQPAACGPYIDALSKQSRNGKECPHADGYGIALFTNGHWIHWREQCPIWDGQLDGLREVKANIMILHSRKASDPTSINLTKLHPFCWPGRPPGVMFCQNGTIRQHEKLKTRLGADSIDTEKYFDLVIQELEQGRDLSDGILNAAEMIYNADSEPTSINALMSDGKSLVAYKGRILPENVNYHTLWTTGTDEVAIVSTEPFEGHDWNPLEGVWKAALAR